MKILQIIDSVSRFHITVTVSCRPTCNKLIISIAQGRFKQNM